MIAVIELFIEAFGHEEFNAGTLSQLAQAYPNTDIVYFARTENIKYVSALIEESERIQFCAIDELISDGKIQEAILEICKKNENLSAMIFTDCNAKGYWEISKVIDSLPDISFLIMLHGEVEYLITDAEIKMNRWYTFHPRAVVRNIVEFVSSIASIERRKRSVKYVREGLRALAQRDNVRLLGFSTTYSKYQNAINSDIISKTTFIHLPYVLRLHPTLSDVADVCKNCFRIGLMPSVVADGDANVWKLIRYVYKNRDRCKRSYEFVFFRRRKEWARNTVTWEDWDPGRKNVRRFYNGVDWILIPYGEKKYLLSSSGIMADAVQMEKPTFVYQSHCFDDFDQYDVAVRGYTITELGEMIIEQINNYDNERRARYRKNLVLCKKKMNDENVAVFRELELRGIK